jgi:hypothetical protein
MSQVARTDGSALADRRRRVVIDTTDRADRWRYRCPRGHVDWSRTNNHIWCKGCRRQADAGEDVDPEHYEIVDAKTDEEIPWSAVEVRK